MSLAADLAALIASLCPERCPRCSCESRRGFCPDCRREFVPVVSPCPACALPGPCADCPARRPDWALDRIVAPWRYAEPLAGQLHALKYRGARHLGGALGQLLADALEERGECCDALVAVPLHPLRLRERHFNQADEIARAVGRRFRCRMLVATRTRHTPAQTALGRSARLTGPTAAFAMRARLDGMEIAIVDDVITTGATVNAFALELRRAGAARVAAFAVARTVGRDAASGDQPARNR